MCSGYIYKISILIDCSKVTKRTSFIYWMYIPTMEIIRSYLSHLIELNYRSRNTLEINSLTQTLQRYYSQQNIYEHNT